MQNLKKYSIIAILTLSLVAGIFNNVPSHASHGQEGNQTQTQAAEAGEEKEHSEASTTVRDSVTILLQGMSIPGTDFIHLYDSTPYHIMNGHIALKVPCGDDSTSPIQVLIGSAPNMTAATLENLPSLSTPGEQCLYHVDLIPGGNVTLTDIAISNAGEEDIDFPPTATVVISINEVTKGEHGGEHSESTEEHASTTSTAAAEAEAEHTE
jgi:hypothetical protein